MNITKTIRIIKVNSKEIQPPYYLNDTHLSLHGAIIGVVLEKTKISASKGSIYTIKEVEDDELFSLYGAKNNSDSKNEEDSQNLSMTKLKIVSPESDVNSMILNDLKKLDEDDLILVYDIIKRLLKKQF